MNDDATDSLEQHILGALPSRLPAELRNIVLAKVSRQLTAAKWERRLGRTAAALIIVGIGLNWAATVRYSSPLRTNLSQSVASAAIVEMGVTMAQATDAETGSQWARHLAALSGRTLTDRQVAEIHHGARKSTSGSIHSTQKEG